MLTACGGGEPAAQEPTSQSAGETSKLDSVKITENGDKKAPGVEFDKPLDVKETTVKVITEGDGDPVKENQVVDISIVAFNGTDGSTLEDTFPNDPEPLELNDELKTSSPIIYAAFVGAKIGSYLALAVPGQAAAEGADAATARPTQLLVVKVISAKDAPKVLDGPEGDPVVPPAGLPTVTEDDKGNPVISVDGVIRADGPHRPGPDQGPRHRGQGNRHPHRQLRRSQPLRRHKVFDSSFDRGEKATFPLTGVIQGWTQGLTGKTVGSRVLLVIPKDLAYGDEGQGDAKGDLVFVVDILGVK